MNYHLHTPLTPEKLAILKAGDAVLLSGTIYTARDAAHARLFALLKKNRPLPFDLTGTAIYYAGPTPARPGDIIGSCGPTTSGRMDAYTPALLKHGLIAMIGKGQRNREVCDAIVEAQALYFAAIGGAGALMASCITKCQIVCYEDLGSEAVRCLTIKDMPLTVVLDTAGGNLYETGTADYLNSLIC